MGFLKFVNRGGFPSIESVKSNLTSTAETFTFSNHPFVRFYFQGGLFIKVTGSADAPSTAVPIMFDTENVSNSSIAVCNAQGSPYTTATWPGDGVYLGFYDSDTKLLRLLN